MKRLTERRRRWFAHRQRKQARRERRRLLGRPLVTVITPSTLFTGKAPRRLSDMPAVLCFDENPDETISILSEFGRRMRIPMRGVRSHARASKHRRGRKSAIASYTSFETLRVITPAAALVLAAEFERVRQLAGSEPFVVDIEKWDPSVLKTLWEIGFFEIVGFPEGAETPRPLEDEAIIRMNSGMTTDGKAVTKLVESLRQLFPGSADESGANLLHLYGAMIEAIENVVRHAYRENANYWGLPSRRWWMTGAVNRRAHSMTAIVYDQGATIPVTLPRWRRYAGWKERIATVLGGAPDVSDSSKDGRVIEVAMEESVSSTGESHHGNGLAQVREFVNKCREGRLRILSRCGEYVFRTGGQPEIKTYPVPIRGTLIEWKVSL